MEGNSRVGASNMKNTLASAVQDYELSREITSEYAYQLRYAVRRFELWLGREATTRDLKKRVVNQWLLHERNAGEISDRTRQNVRTSLLTLWKYCGRKFNREKIRSIVVTPKNPEAWHFDELSAVANAAAELPGSLSNGIDRALYFVHCLWFTYETGVRRGDVWSFDLSTFDSQRVAARAQNKTKRIQLVQITAETETGLREISNQLRSKGDEHYRTPLRWPQSESQFYYWMRQCRADAGIEPKVSNRSLQHIRRTGATEVESQGGNAWQYLGHSRDGLAKKSYVDARKTVSPITPARNRTNGSDQKKRA